MYDFKDMFNEFLHAFMPMLAIAVGTLLFSLVMFIVTEVLPWTR